MKAPSARLAMLLSIGGVLVAGSAAAVVNSQVLDDQSAGAPASATAIGTTTLDAVTTTSAPTTAAPTTTQPATTAATVAPTIATTAVIPSTLAPVSSVAVTVPAAPAGSTQATYRLGVAGTALLDTAGGRLTVVSVTPAPGWFLDRAESEGASVDIRLESASGEVRFEASLVSGVVRVSLDTDNDSESGSGDSGSGGGDSGSGGGNSGHGGGDDDDNSGPGS